MSEREYDIVLFGATGFAGGLTARYLAEQVPAGCRWALAGRNLDKLEKVRAGLGTASADLPLLVVDAADAPGLLAIARSTRVIASTIGPFVQLGEPLVAACAEAGTDYADLTGEPEFVDGMYVRHHARAVASGARLVHACGFDSVPHDLGAYFTVRELQSAGPVTMRGYVQADAAASGGTFASLLNALARGRSNLAASRRRSRLERPDLTRARAVTGRPHHDHVTGGWALPLSTLDPQVVVRSARTADGYGPSFRYSHFVSLPQLRTAAGAVSGIAALAVLAQIRPARRALLARLPQGTGPSAARRARSWFRVTFVAESGGRRVVTRVSGGDPGYDETARMLGEAALCLAFDELPPTRGQVTPVTAMGAALLGRLQRSGLRFEVLSSQLGR